MTPTAETVLEHVAKVYLESRDFNGTPQVSLLRPFGVEWPALRPVLVDLIRDERIGVVYADSDVNSHILRLGFKDVAAQIEKLGTETEFVHTCAYPGRAHTQPWHRARRRRRGRLNRRNPA